jgi:plasmid stability protein
MENKRKNVPIDYDVHKELKIMAIRKDREMKDLVNEILENYLKQEKSAGHAI